MTPSGEAVRGGAADRVLRDIGEDTIAQLDALSGPDLTTLLLELMARRARAETPRSVLHRHAHDRSVAPVPVPFDLMRRTEDAILGVLPDGAEVVPLSPMVPLGTHAALGPVDPRIVVATVRRTEVAADPTDGLALVAATRRRALLRDDPRSTERVRLAALQRVVRTQPFEGNAAFPHFAIAGLITAGRVERAYAFERETLIEHIEVAVRAFRAMHAQRVRVGITDLRDGAMAPVLDRVRSTISESLDVEVVDEPDRQRGRGYYEGCCFQVYAGIDGVPESIADGGLIDWTQRLLASRKERLCISGIGVERLALANASG